MRIRHNIELTEKQKASFFLFQQKIKSKVCLHIDNLFYFYLDPNKSISYLFFTIDILI